MKKLGVYASTAVGATAVWMAFLGTGVAADDYAGQTYGDASTAISDAGKKVVIASRAGDTLSDDKCVVTHSQSAPWIKGDSFAPVTDTVLAPASSGRGARSQLRRTFTTSDMHT